MDIVKSDFETRKEDTGVFGSSVRIRFDLGGSGLN